jgi:hypothetical protein
LGDDPVAGAQSAADHPVCSDGTLREDLTTLSLVTAADEENESVPANIALNGGLRHEEDVRVDGLGEERLHEHAG